MTKIFSPAKINLFLHVTGKRPDGYHDLFTLMCRINLMDTVMLDFDTKQTSVSCAHPMVPEDKSNLAFKAAVAFYKSFGKYDGVGITIEKKIPVGGGLGGGSSNAAAVLMGLNRHFGKPFSKQELMNMGLSIGADVPFFIFQKPALARGVGEKLEYFKLLKPYHVLLIDPGYHVSTAQVYGKLNLGLTKCEKKYIESSFNKDGFNVEEHLCNDLESVTAHMHPDIKSAKELLLYHGAMGALMSGSGSTVFGLFLSSDIAQKAYHCITRYRREQMYLAEMMV